MTLAETFRALFAWRQPRKPEPDWDETRDAWLKRISKLGR